MAKAALQVGKAAYLGLWQAVLGIVYVGFNTILKIYAIIQNII
jgi:hypothetical protein